VNDELKKMWKEAAVAYFNMDLVALYFPGGTDENHEVSG
jgi:hypothetical protein